MWEDRGAICTLTEKEGTAPQGGQEYHMMVDQI